MTFPNQDDFVNRHEAGTIIEMENEIKVLKDFNEKRQKFVCWVVAPLPGTKTVRTRSWLLLVEAPLPPEDALFPVVGDCS